MSENDMRQHDTARHISRLVSQLYRSRRIFMNNRLKDTGIKGPSYMILTTLDRNPGSTQDAVAQLIAIDKSGIARAARELETLGYIRRETDDENRRQNRLYLTESGRSVLPVIRESFSEWGAKVTEGMSSEQIEQVIALLEMMSENSAV